MKTFEYLKTYIFYIILEYLTWRLVVFGLNRSRLVHQHLLSEVLVQESLLQHFSALRSLLLLHDAHFARALTVNLFNKVCLLNISPCKTLFLIAFFRYVF